MTELAKQADKVERERLEENGASLFPLLQSVATV
jgi:hypothetical protein